MGVIKEGVLTEAGSIICKCYFTVYRDSLLPWRCTVEDTSRVFTGSADNSARLWDVETGKEVSNFGTGSAVRTCGFSHNGNYLMYSTDAALGLNCEIILYDIRATESPIG